MTSDPTTDRHREARERVEAAHPEPKFKDDSRGEAYLWRGILIGREQVFAALPDSGERPTTRQQWLREARSATELTDRILTPTTNEQAVLDEAVDDWKAGYSAGRRAAIELLRESYDEHANAVIRATIPEGLRKAAAALVQQAEPDDDFEGDYIDYLVPAEAVDALRAALATTPAPEARQSFDALVNSLAAPDTGAGERLRAALDEAQATIEAMSGDAADLHDLIGEAAGMRTVLQHLLGDDRGRIHDSGCGTCDAGRALLTAEHELPSRSALSGGSLDEERDSDES